MSCQRGCTGTPICSALDICCIQFRQDCGKGCNGLADGYSVIQINADGELEVCSNVGGVCTCEEAAGACCSTLTPNLDGTWTHDDGIGNLTTLDVCELLRESNCILQDVQFTGVGTTVIPSPLAPGTPATELEAPTFITVNNPSDENMECTLHISGSQLQGININGNAQDSLTLATQWTLDGGANWGTFAGQDTTIFFDAPGTFGSAQEATHLSHVLDFAVPSGGTITVGFRRVYSSANGFDGQAFADTSTITSECLAIPV